MLQGKDFDPLEYLNHRFPDQASLVGLDQEIDSLTAQLHIIDQQLNHEVLQHALASEQVMQEIIHSKQTSKEIIADIREIKQKAAESEEVVYEMCKDLKSLDIAKNNLTGSIVALKKFIMMVTAYEKLRQSCESRNYKQTAHLVSAFKQMSMHFKTYEEVPQMNELLRDFTDLINQLKQQLIEDFEDFDRDKLKPDEFREVCAVVEALGTTYTVEFIGNAAQILIKPYEEMYSASEQLTLENVQRRYGWLKRKLEEYNQKYDKVVPADWVLPVYLYIQFCAVTKIQLLQVLESRQNPVPFIMKALEVTLRFEGKAGEDVQQRMKAVKNENFKPKHIRVREVISGSFTNFLGPYLLNQEETLRQNMRKNLQSDRVDLSSDLNVFSSGILTFNGIKSFIKRASSYLKGAHMQDVIPVVRKVLKWYICELQERLVKQERAKRDEFETAICFIINTCEYCKDAIIPLQEMLSTSKEMGEVSLQDENEMFSTVISKSFEVFLNVIDGKFEQFTAFMIKGNFWQKLETVEDSLPYVKETKFIVHKHVEKVKAVIAKTYVFFYLNKVVVTIVNRLISQLLKLRRPPSKAIFQLQMDVAQLKEVLISTGITKDSKLQYNEKVLSSFKNFTVKSFLKLQNVLKLIEMSIDNFTAKFEALYEGATLHDLDRLLAVKGLKRSEVASLVRVLETR